MSLLARAPLLRQQAVRSSFTAPSRGAREYHHLPFAWPKSKAVWGAKVGAFLLTGFSIPFIATWFQLKKAADGA